MRSTTSRLEVACGHERAMPGLTLKVGELARRTGVSVRTLHYYDEIGLLSPSQHTAVGHRRYTAPDVVRLQQVVSLRQLGFSLEEVKMCLDTKGAGFSPQAVVELHIEGLQKQIATQQRLCHHLEAIAASLGRAEEVSVEQFIMSIEEISKMENKTSKYYTPEQLEYLKQRAEVVGADRVRQVETEEWPNLFRDVEAEMDRGTDPSDERAQALARRWQGLVAEFTGGNPGIEKSLQKMYKEEETPIHPSMPPRMSEYMDYINKAIAASKQPE